MIELESVSKRFVIGPGRSGDLREMFAGRRRAAKTASEFWALRDVSFTVTPGKPLGIIGHNGSGKSTLLKLLTGILKPTTGSVRIKGRVGALIEVGAGFHPDLSGRENIFLNGSILGLSRREISAKFDAIVAFAGLEKFIDTPVKRYSSGMYMRLGFAVAAHTDPDILLVDEVLAVGDALFQRKCLRHLEDYVAKGGAVVFVSHAMSQTMQLCKSCVWLDHGRVRYIGPTEDAVDQYMNVVAKREDEEFKRSFPSEWEAQQAIKQELQQADLRAANEQAEQAQALWAAKVAESNRRHQERVSNPYISCLLDMVLSDATGHETVAFAGGQEMRVCIGFRTLYARTNLVIGIEIFRSDDTYMFAVSNYQYDLPLPVAAGIGEVNLIIPYLALNVGTYYFRVSLFPEPSEPRMGQAPGGSH